MLRARTGELLSILCLVLACQSAPASKQAGQGGSNTTAGSIGGTTVGSSGATEPSAGGSGLVSSSSGGATLSAGGTAGGGIAATGGVPVATNKITLSKASARIGGRRGDALHVTVEGKAAVGVFGAIEVGLLDASGSGLPYFDNNWDGLLDSTVGRVQPLKPPTTATFTVEAVMSGAKSMEGLSQLQVALYDRENGRTDPVTIPIQEQPIVELGGACDTTYVVNRCREGSACAGTPALCVAGTAPTIAHAAFQRGTEGPFIRVDGVDRDEDVILVRVDFLSATDSPISLDLDGDDVLDADHLEVDVGIVNQNGGYTFVVESGQGFEVQVPRLGLTAIDSKGNVSATQRVSISTRTTRVSGQSCDLTGFVGCVSGTTCLPGSGTNQTAYCNTYAQAETAKCSAAATWDLSKDPLKITGLISGYSAWEPPAGCLSNTSNSRPEAIIKMHVAKAMPTLILSTAEPETLIDTGIVVLPSCTADAATAVGCNDDTIGYTSSLTLSNVAAGDYYVIVEAVQSDGGSFGLSARTQ